MSTQRTQRGAKVLLVAGALGLLGAVLLAHRNPATGYELSLYRSTPSGVWAGLGLAAVVGVLVAVGGRGRFRDGGMLLTGSSALAVFALPVLRGYFFYGSGDSLSHLGFAREVLGGSVAAVDLLYPTIHVGTVAIAEVGGVPLPLANLYLVLVLFPALYLAFVPLCARLLAGGPRALVVGLFAAATFAPINHVAMHPQAHPASQAALFLPVALFLVLEYATGADGRNSRGRALADGGWRPSRATAFGALLALTSATVVLNHPQQALNVVVLFGAVAATQAFFRRFRPSHAIARHRPLYVQTGLLVALFLLWTPRFSVVQAAITGAVQSVLTGTLQTGEVVTVKSQSVSAVGGEVVVLFVRLFLPALVLSVLAGVLVLGVLRRTLANEEPRADGLLVYLSAALAPLFVVFLFLVALPTGDMYFRYQGFIMVPVTVLGAVALAHLYRRDEGVRLRSNRRSAALVAALLVLLVPVAGLALHPSPHIYQPTPHVTQSQFGGYENSFETRIPDREFVGIRGGPRRYVDAVYGTERAETTLDFPGYRDAVPERVFATGNYTTYFTDDRYFAVTSRAYDREVRLYAGFRYAPRGFDRLSATPGVSRVRVNEGFRLYYVDAAGG